MIKYPNFSNEQWKEIEEARERLSAFKEKIQPYPVLPEKILAKVSQEEWVPKQWDAITQLRAGYIHLQKKLNEHLDRKRDDVSNVRIVD